MNIRKLVFGSKHSTFQQILVISLIPLCNFQLQVLEVETMYEQLYSLLDFFAGSILPKVLKIGNNILPRLMILLLTEENTSSSGSSIS